MAKRRGCIKDVVQDMAPLIKLWLLRILVPLGAMREFVRGHSYLDSDALSEAIGLEPWVEDRNGEFDAKAAKAELKRLHQRAEKRPPVDLSLGYVRKNIERLSQLVGLSAVDCKILEFAVSLKTERLLDDASDWLGQLSSIKAYHVLSVILNVQESELRMALGLHSTLCRSGLVSIDHCGSTTLSRKLDLLSESFADLMTTYDADPIGLLRGTVSLASEGQLGLDSFQHIQPSLDILLPYLRHASLSKRRGVNIFLYGVPGTGKSELARALAADLACELFEVASEGSDGVPVDGERRLRAFSASQSFLGKRRALIVFDEVEDVFDDGNQMFGKKSTAQLRKAWLNRMLEENPVPAVWLSNSISGLDPAFVRRFDMVFELPVPPKIQRERILKDRCGDILDSRQIARIAEADYLAPAVVTKASSIVRSIQDELGAKNAASAFERLICNTLEAQGHRPIVRQDPNRLPDVYDPAFITADADLVEVANGLGAVRAGRLCLYGPPGTGKTAYGRWLAEQLGMPLLVKRASDLMSKWVGDNEKNVARAFREAEQEGALLLIDEVDSFLRDRRGAARGWEVTLVNEMLTQMESFSGVFIASTNLMDGLDQAALRRFDLKVMFGYLRPEQAWELLKRHCRELGFDAPQPQVLNRIMRLKQLTPGDFAAVLRQHRFRPLESPASFVTSLEAECLVKEGAKASIGFLS